VRQTDRQTERKRQRERDRDRQTERDTDRHTDRQILSIFGDKCPQNGSKNEVMAPRTRWGYRGTSLTRTPPPVGP